MGKIRSNIVSYTPEWVTTTEVPSLNIHVGSIPEDRVGIFSFPNFHQQNTQFKKLGEHVFEMYAMFHKIILHTQVYYQLNLYSLLLKYTTEHRWIRVHFQNRNGNVQIGA